jgi:hypothetical protein
MGAADEFSFALLRASRVAGSSLEIALYLDVRPKQIFEWIGGLNRPSGAQRRQLEARLRMFLARQLPG